MNAYQEFKMIGSRPIRPDGLDKVTGRARYGADLKCRASSMATWSEALMHMR